MSVMPRRKTIIPTPVFGMLIFVFVEIMFFSALFSSYFVIRRGREDWIVPGAAHMPVLASGFNTLVLLLSCFFLFLPGRRNIIRAAALGTCFVGYQSYLGAKLVAAGMTMKSSFFGAFFFLIVGAHGLHALFGIAAMTSLLLGARRMIDLNVLKSKKKLQAIIV